MRSHDLLDIPRIGVEHEDQRLVVEVCHLALERGYVGYTIAVGEIVARDDCPRRLRVKQRVLLCRERPEHVSNYGVIGSALPAIREDLLGGIEVKTEGSNVGASD